MTHEKLDKDTKAHLLLKTSGQLVRESLSPHSPIWLPGAEYPAQYLVRQTRSMTTRYNTLDEPQELLSPLVLLVSIPRCLVMLRQQRKLCLPSLKQLKIGQELDFFLPDRQFLNLKLAKLRSVQKQQKQEKGGLISKRHSSHSNDSVSISCNTPGKCVDGNKMLSSYPFCIEGSYHQKTFSYREVSPLLSLNSPCCTYRQLTEATYGSTIPLSCMGCLSIPSQINNNIFDWAINQEGSRLLIIVNNLMGFFDSTGKLLGSVNLPESTIKHFQCLELLSISNSTSLAIIGAYQCNLWIMSGVEFPLHLLLFEDDSQCCQKLHHAILLNSHVSGLHSVWSNNDKGVIATAFELPSVSLWITTFTMEGHQLRITNQFKLPLLQNESREEDHYFLTCLCFIQESNHLLALNKNLLLIWDYHSCTLLKVITLQCNEGPHIPAVIINTFQECDHIFVVISSKPPTPTLLINSCCWLITVTMTTHPYMDNKGGQDEFLDKAYLVYAYLLPSDPGNEKSVSVVCSGVSCNKLTAALSNGVIVIWDVYQANPSGYFNVSGLEIHSCVLIDKKLWIYNSTERQIYIYSY